MEFKSTNGNFSMTHTVENESVEITDSKFKKNGKTVKQLVIRTVITTVSTTNGNSAVSEMFSGSSENTFVKTYVAFRTVADGITKAKAVKIVKDTGLIAMKISAPNVIMTAAAKRRMEIHGASLNDIAETQRFVTKNGDTIYSVGFIAPFGKAYLGLIDLFGLTEAEIVEAKKAEEFTLDSISVSLNADSSWLADEVADEVETDELEAAQNQFEDIFSD